MINVLRDLGLVLLTGNYIKIDWFGTSDVGEAIHVHWCGVRVTGHFPVIRNIVTYMS